MQRSVGEGELGGAEQFNGLQIVSRMICLEGLSFNGQLFAIVEELKAGKNPGIWKVGNIDQKMVNRKLMEEPSSSL